MDFTTLAAVKQYLGIPTANQDALIQALISRESRLITDFLNADVAPAARVDYPLNGTGRDVLSLPDTPIVIVSSVKLGQTVVPASADGVAYGFTFDESAVYLVGDVFPRGRRNVFVSWQAGYQGSEAGFVPVGATPTYTPTDEGRAIQDQGVVYVSNGHTLVLVGSNPAVGQYTFSGGVYGFNTAEAGAQVRFTYLAVPAPIEQACIEMVGLDLKQRDNLGINSKSLAGETVSYTTKGMTDSVKEMVAPYKRRFIATP